MATYVEKVEYHVYEAGEDSPSQWLEDRDEAIATATAWNGRVEKVTYYANDRKEIFNAAAAVSADDNEDEEEAA